MGYKITNVTWTQRYTPDYRHGWTGEPDKGTDLGIMYVRVEPDRVEGYEYLGFEFRGILNFYKEIAHEADPIYSVRFSGGEKFLTEEQVPADVLEAFESGVDFILRPTID